MQTISQNSVTFKDFIPLVSAIIVVLFGCIGWYLTHWLNSIRDRKNKNREIRLQYLIEVFRAFVDANGRDLREERDYAQKLEAAVRDIQLFGSETQIKNLIETIKNYETGVDDTSKVIQSLRDELRKELDMSEISSRVTWLVVDNHELKSNEKKQLNRKTAHK